MKKIFKKSKKAILMPETLKIIIAVMCLILLIYLAVSLSSLFKKTDKDSIDFNNRLVLLRNFVSMPLKDSLILGGIKDRLNEESKVFNLITVYCKEKEELDKQRLEETLNRHFKDFFEPILKQEPLRAFFRLEIGCNKKVWGITSGGKAFFIGDSREYDLKNQEVKEVIININPDTGFEMKLEDRQAGEIVNAVKLITKYIY